MAGNGPVAELAYAKATAEGCALSPLPCFLPRGLTPVVLPLSFLTDSQLSRLLQGKSSLLLFAQGATESSHLSFDWTNYETYLESFRKAVKAKGHPTIVVLAFQPPPPSSQQLESGYIPGTVQNRINVVFHPYVKAIKLAMYHFRRDTNLLARRKMVCLAIPGEPPLPSSNSPTSMHITPTRLLE